jgi:transcriptional regulator with XRE-family HTH domain
MTTFGDRVIEIRKKRKITQEELGNAIGVDKRVISKYEKNQTVPSVITANAIANSLETSIDYLMNDSIDKFANSELIDKEILRLFKEVHKLNEKNKEMVRTFIDAFLTKVNK